MHGATLEALMAAHPAGKAASLLQQRAYKMKGKEGMALRQRIITLEEQATGIQEGIYSCFTSHEVHWLFELPLTQQSMSHEKLHLTPRQPLSRPPPPPLVGPI